MAHTYVIERRRHWASSDTTMGARRVIRLDQARDATIKACEDAARRLEHGPDPEASALIKANSETLLHSFAPIRVD